jgi:alpha-glucoside transport system permease protein
VWVWAGFCAVLLSAALNAIPMEVFDAARADGARSTDVFWRITLPLIGPTMAVVATTMVITSLKVFDIVYVMTSGNFGTDVIAHRMYTELFTLRHFGRAGAIATILLVMIAPVMIANVRGMLRSETAS